MQSSVAAKVTAFYSPSVIILKILKHRGVIMLTSMREGAKSGFTKFILLGFMAMAVGGLVLMDVGGFFGGGGSNNTVAKVGKSSISSVEFDRTVRRKLSKQGIDTESAYRLGLVHKILNAQISASLMNIASHDLGINISDGLIAEKINSLIEPYVSDDMTKKDAFKRILMSQGMSEKEFVNAIRGELASTILRNALQSGTTTITSQEASDLYKYYGEARDVEYISFLNESITDMEKPSDDILQSLYDSGKERYAIHENRSFSMIVLSDNNFKTTQDVSEEDIREVYESNIEDFKLFERRVLQQSIVSSENSANNIIDEVSKGVSLEKAVINETGDGDAYFGEDNFQKDDLLEELRDSVFSADKGSVIGPIQTVMGWHVLYLKDILPPKTKSYSEVKDNIREEILHELLMEEMFSSINDIDDRLASEASLDDIASEYNSELINYGPLYFEGNTVDHKDALQNFSDDRMYIMETVFELLEGEISPVLELSDGRFVIIRTESINPKTYKTLDDVKDELVDMWNEKQRESLNKLKVKGLVDSLEAGEIDLHDFAKENGIDIKELDDLERSGSLPDDITARNRDDFFRVAAGEYGFSDTEEGFVVFKVNNIEIPADEDVTDEDIENVIKLSSQGSMDEFMYLYLDDLHKKQGVTINKRLLDNMYKPQSE
jgi:peptidyl-prolyl cis-trans isomerase D